MTDTQSVERLYKEFGQRLRKAREDAQLTQKEVADRVGLKRTSITNIERGRQVTLPCTSFSCFRRPWVVNRRNCFPMGPVRLRTY